MLVCICNLFQDPNHKFYWKTLLAFVNKTTKGDSSKDNNYWSLIIVIAIYPAFATGSILFINRFFKLNFSLRFSGENSKCAVLNVLGYCFQKLMNFLHEFLVSISNFFLNKELWLFELLKICKAIFLSLLISIEYL